MVGMALPMGGFVAQTITDGRPGSEASAAHHPAAALHPKEVVERKTIATAIGSRQGADPAVAQGDSGPLQTRIRIFPVMGRVMTLCGVETTGPATTAVHPEMTVGQTARETTALAEVGLRAWSGAIIASVSATFTDDRIDPAMRGFIVGVGAACTTDRIRLGMHDTRGHDISKSHYGLHGVGCHFGPRIKEWKKTWKADKEWDGNVFPAWSY